MELWNSLIFSLLADGETSSIMAILTQVGLWAKVAIGIGLVIFVHELGHFVAAKACGVKCEKFYVGFDPPLKFGPIKLPSSLVKFQWGETEYGIGVIPLGGYVKMLGQDDDPRKAAEEAERIRIKNEDAEPGDEDAVQLDPRSFQAKSVLQRMIIISAGVIVNVITAVMFAAVAFWYGVPYTPAVVGNTQPGDPAWVAGIAPGSQIVSVGTIEDYEKLQFRDMTMEIIESGIADKTKPISMKTRAADGTEKSYELMPTLRHDPKNRAVSIGVANQLITELPKDELALPDTIADEVLDSSFKGAVVVKLNGKALEKTGDEILATPLLKEFAANPSKDVTLTFSMSDGTTKDVVIPPQPRKSIGCSFQPGPITGIVAGSNAEKSGLKVGDQIISFNGQENLSGFELRDLSSHAASASLVVQRTNKDGSKESLNFEIEPDGQQSFLTFLRLGADLALDRFQIAFAPSNRIASIQEGSALDEVFDPGDVVSQVSVAWPNADVKKKVSKLVFKDLIRGDWELNAFTNSTLLIAQLQHIPEGLDVRVIGERGEDGKVLDATAQVKQEKDQFWYARGIRFMPVKRVHVAESVAESFALGYRESLRRGQGVLRFLGLLVTGKLDADVVGGPVAIFSIAGSHAAEGIPRLLMFLTFLSINLAILNFLPIPALDGGHMVFLIAEAVLGRPIDEEKQMQLTFFGVLLLLSLMAFAFYNDISRLFTQ